MRLKDKVTIDDSLFNKQDIIFIYEETMDTENDNHLIKGYRQDANKIVSATLYGQIGILKELLDALYLSLSSKVNFHDVKMYYFVLCFLLKVSAAESNIDMEIINKNDFENYIANANSLLALHNYVRSFFISTAEAIAQIFVEDTMHKKKVIGEVKSFIEQNYQKDLTLKKIGQHIHLSPSYISCLFKMISGETYTDYLKLVRIQKAKILLSKIDLKIYEVAEKVGYTDYKYFTLQFKKITGMSPTTYRNLQQRIT